MPKASNNGGANNGGANIEAINYAQRLRNDTIACRVHHDKMGVRRALTKDQIASAASQFDAQPRSLVASKKLIDTAHPAYRAVVQAKSRANKYWKAVSVPYPEPGLRLIRRNSVAQFREQMEKFYEELNEAKAKLQEAYAELRDQARTDLGDLFNPDDYPQRIDLEFDLSWDFPSVEPPAYLKQVHPQLYEAESARIAARFEEAVAMTEQAFTQKFAQLVSHLTDRLQGGADGQRRKFHASTVTNLQEFFSEFRALNVGSNQELDKLIEQAQQAVAGVDVNALRDDEAMREQLGTRLGTLQEQIDALMVDRGSRAIELPPELPAESDANTGDAA